MKIETAAVGSGRPRELPGLEHATLDREGAKQILERGRRNIRTRECRRTIERFESEELGFLDAREEIEAGRRRRAVELRKIGGRVRVSGYACRWGVLSEVLRRRDGQLFQETFRWSTFAESIEAGEVVGLVGHRGQPVARQLDGTLVLTEDADGLRVDMVLPDTAHGRDVAARVRSGELGAWSFSFNARADEWQERKARPPVRTVSRAELLEVSLVRCGAHRGRVLVSERKRITLADALTIVRNAEREDAA